MSAEKVIFWNMVKIYAILNGLFQVAWIFNTPFLSRRRELCYFWLSLEFSLRSWLVRVSAFKADISFLFSICYINRVNSYRVPKLWRKQRTLFTSPYNWQHLALSILLAQFCREAVLCFLPDTEVLTTGRSEARSVMGRRAEEGSLVVRTTIIKEINTSIVGFGMGISPIFKPTFWEIANHYDNLF